MWRRLLTSTRVRLVPRPRRSSRLRPAVPMKRVELPELNEERSDGRSLRLSPRLTSPVSVSSWMPTEVIGTVDSRLGRRMREPVTVMAPPSVAGAVPCVPTSPAAQASRSAWVGRLEQFWPADGVSCAAAGVAKPAMARAATEAEPRMEAWRRRIRRIPQKCRFLAVALIIGLSAKGNALASRPPDNVKPVTLMPHSSPAPLSP